MKEFLQKVTKVTENLTIILGVVSALGSALQLFTDKITALNKTENETAKD